MQVISFLSKLGFTEKETQVYLALLNLGPSSVRALATASKVNRGTTYDILKSLIKRGLVSYYHRDTHQYFLAENPDRIGSLIGERLQVLDTARGDFNAILPELQSMYNKQEEKPVVKYYEGTRGVRTILEDVLKTVALTEHREYYAFSASDVRKFLYQDFPNYAKERVKKKIKCKVIASGSGGELWGLDERKWISKTESSPTYKIIYHGKVALISLNSRNVPMGMIVEDSGIYQTDKMIFEYIWRTITKNKTDLCQQYKPKER